MAVGVSASADTRPVIVVAIGGNALLHRGEAPSIAVQRANVARAAAALAGLAATHRVVLTHGNGPQVGLLARQSTATPESGPVPLDVLDAETAGLIGYLLATALGAHLPPEEVAVLLTRVDVDRTDPAFARPDKPVGADRRRVVASPVPHKIVELDAIAALVADGRLVVCGGGGGLPVAAGADGVLAGVEAVIDKDRTSALIAEALGAVELLVLTDVAAIVDGWGTDTASPISRTTPAELRAGIWQPGSMAPKVDAVCSFVERTGRRARVGALDDASAVLAGRAGTLIEPG